jgi:hypothetical protein
MNDSGSGTDDLRCIEFVSLVTAYLDGEVDEHSAEVSTSISKDAGAAGLRSTNSRRSSASPAG